MSDKTDRPTAQKIERMILDRWPHLKIRDGIVEVQRGPITTSRTTTQPDAKGNRAS